MPLMRATKNGKPCYRFGEVGKCYAYTAGDAASRGRAWAKALRQGRAIERSKQTRG